MEGVESVEERRFEARYSVVPSIMRTDPQIKCME
jgi:hypothetical protein